MTYLFLIADSIPYSSPSTHEDSIVLSGRTATTSTGRKRKAKSSASWVWNHFKLVKDSNKSLIIFLEPIGSHNSRCTTSFSAKTGTSSLSRHLLVKHNISKGHKSGDPLQTFFGVNGDLQDPYELDNESKEANLNALVAFVVDHQQAFNLEAIALTLDCWSSRVMRGYMVITVHWIDEEWKLQSVVLEFRYFPPPHNQHTTSDLILSVVKDYNMWSKIKAITSDSGGEMPLAMVIVRENLNDQYSLRLEDGFHIRCICHVINRVVCDATHFIKKEVQMLRQILKAVRGSVAIRVKFSELAVVLGVSKGRVEVLGLDMETRGNTMFTMIDHSFQYRGVFSALCNSEEFCDRLANMALSDMDWRVLKSCKDFLQSAYHCTVAASGRDYISLSLQPLIYKHLLTLCEKTRSGQLDTGFTTPIVKQAATAMELKLLKYSANLNCQASKMALLLDPRSSNASSETMELKDQLRFILTMDYGLCSEHSNRFPTLSLMARDTLMIQGSSVASESAFSESGGFVRPDRSKLSNENIEMMMKLKSWNRLFRE
ncbi:hypothetical protein Mp_2g26060 [Marchantia polymorpha subsp. ruderalis]|uniref:HAT C-terminal dimerisation domain-containing protein n=1 Tax=Marchantia polymorpha TaxID=3197 RepID=A0A2R6XB80_MARPO|nr:hypothetical protein MARPO_0116s0054 [Marchantia polymorpha]PTQ43381.1 hypothetical protein MARPO_0025s0072 [Marchantia polymorpha]BBN03751.1 hypothetical protein Mp_2g26060 [Marchantia polymorpha subsp. ruderalis]|eukprot:PTQ31070.1 hypothetical protein MARPO_0116s0054 [Marchantia polymorpha]